MTDAAGTLATTLVDRVIDRGFLSDAALRPIIRHLLRRRLDHVRRGGVEARAERHRELLAELRRSPIALHTDDANDQHYEVPTEFFELLLGPHLKYSAAHYRPGVTDLADAEADMLALTCRRAQLRDGQDILELGCGWGSLTLWMAAEYPNARITAVSNSATQRERIEKQAFERGLDNVRVVTRDINAFGVDDTEPVVAGGFDRVVSVEMFEHVRNYQALLRRVASWLRPGGKLFVHHFSNRDVAYAFDTGGRADWMARHFFTGGLMPSHDLLLAFQDDLRVEDQWAVSGTHYARTCEDWLARLDHDRSRVRQLFAGTYGPRDADAWVNRWRVFTIACAELFAFDGGDEWHVTHLRFARD